MSNNNRTFKQIKIDEIDEGLSGTPLRSSAARSAAEASGGPSNPLDLLSISGTLEKNSLCYQDWKKENWGKSADSEKGKNYIFGFDRWHTLAFREHAKNADNTFWGYTGLTPVGDDVRHIHGRCCCRWSDEYRRRSYAKICEFVRVCERDLHLTEGVEGVKVDSMHFVTLTARHKNDTKKEGGAVIDALRYAWSHCRRWINRQGWRFVRVAEPGECVAHVHFHIVVLGASDEQIQKFVEKWVFYLNQFGNMASIKAQNWQKCENIRNLGGYISKYIAKTFETEQDNDWFWRWMELIYSARLRVFAFDAVTSRAVSEKYKNPLASVYDLLPGYNLGQFIFDSPKNPIADTDEVAEFRAVSLASKLDEAEKILSLSQHFAEKERVIREMRRKKYEGALAGVAAAPRQPQSLWKGGDEGENPRGLPPISCFGGGDYGT